jgi:hypothetical protein
MKMSNSDFAIKQSISNPKIVARFNKFLKENPDGCIEFSGAKTVKGYGQFCLHGETYPSHPVRAHRFAYALHYGFDKLPIGTDTTQKRKVIHHKCENKACVNPLHLEVVTDRFNLGQVNDKNMF